VFQKLLAALKALWFLERDQDITYLKLSHEERL
jgi:hypothetical protein